MILLLSDQAATAKTIQADLSREGFKVEVANHHADAILRLAQRIHYDIIMIDFAYQKHEVFEICQRLKTNSNQRFMPLIGILKRDQFLDQLVAFEHGVDDFILTPYSVPEIQLKVRSIQRIIEMSEQLRKQEAKLAKLQDIQRVMVTLNHYINNALTPLAFAVQFMEMLPNESNTERLQNTSKDTVEFVSKVLQSLQTVVHTGKAKVVQKGVYKDIMFDIEKELNAMVLKNRQKNG